MDMITSIELEDAIKLTEKVKSRVEHVARFVADAANDLADRPLTDWKVASYHVSSYRDGREDTVTVYLEVLWYRRPITEKYGDPEDDESEFGHPSHLNRVVSFPRRFLFTNNWEEEVLKNAREAARRWATIKIKQTEEAIAENEKRHNNLIKQLEAWKEKAR